MENKFKLKKFLATASAFAMITGASSAAMGAQITDDGVGDVTLANGGGINIVGGPFANNDSFHFTNAGKALTTGGAVTIGSIDLNGQAPGAFTVAHATTVGPIADVAGNGANTLNVTINDGIALTLANNAGKDAANLAIAAGTFTGLGNVTLGSGGGGSSLTIDTSTTLAGTINSDVADDGVVNINAGKTVVFNGVIGAGQKLGEINLVGLLSKATFNANVTADALNLNAATAEATIGDAVTLTGEVVATNAANEGILKFAGSGIVTGDIGVSGGKELNLIKLTGDANSSVQLQGDVAATTTEIGDGKLQLAHGKTIDGNVEATIANNGTLYFDKAGTVTGTIGANAALSKVVANGANGTTVTLGGDTKTGILELSSGGDFTLNGNTTTIDKLTISDANSHVNINNGKELILSGAQNTTIEGDAVDIVFVGDDSKLTFKAEGGNTPVVTINTAALNTGNDNRGKIVLFADGDDGAIAPTDSKLIVRGQALGGANTLRLVSIDGDKIVRLENEGVKSVAIEIAAGSKLEYAPSADVSFNTVTFADAAAQMKLEANGANRTFTLNAHLNPGANDKGTIILHSNGGNIVTFTANGGVKTLGTGANKIHELNTTGDSASVITDQVDLTNVLTLNVKNGSALKSESKTAAAIAAINIGEGAGAGTLTIDSEGGDYDLLNGTAITFAHNDSLLKLTNTTNAGNSTVTLHGNVAPGGGNDLKGKLEINSNGTKTLDIAVNGAKTIGTDNTHRLNELIVSGDQNVEINPAVYAKKITVSSTGDVTFKAAVDGGVADASLIDFTAAGNTTFENDVTAKTIAFGNNARIVTVNDGKILTTHAITSGAGNGSEIILAGNSKLTTGAANNPIALDSIKLGANAATGVLGAGQYTVANIEVLNAGGEAKFQDGFQLTGAINNGTGVAGTVKFLGDAKVTGVLGGAGNAVGAVTVAGNNKTLQLGGSVNATSLNGDNGLGADTQTLKFINVGDITVDGTVGNAQAFKTIEFAGGGKVTFIGAGDLTAPTTNFHFSEDNIVETDGFDIAGTNITNTAGKNNSKFVVNVDQTIAGDIGTNAEKFGELHVNAGVVKNVTLNTANFFAGVTGQNAKVTFNNGAGSSVSYLGTNTQKISNANFVEDGQVFGVVHADTIDVRNGKTAIFDHATFNAALKMHGANAQADFASKITVGSAIEANAGSDGILNFNAGAIVNTNIGADGTRVGATTFGGNTDINANIYSDAINFAGNTVALKKDAIFDGLTTFNGTTVELGDYDLTLKGGNSVITGETEIKTTLAGIDLGNLVVGAGGKVTLKGAGNKLKVTLDAAVVPANGQVLKLIKKEDNGQIDLDLTKLTVEAGAFSQWTPIVKNGELVFLHESQVSEVLQKDAEKTGSQAVLTKDIAEIFENFEPNTPGADYVGILNKLEKSEDRVDGAVRVANTTANEVVGNVFNSLSDITTVLNNRTTTPTTSFNQSIGTNNNVTGISSGDQDNRYGLWATPFYSNAKQKKRKSSSGYKSTAYGGTIGFDTKANEDMLLGMAFSAVNSEIKHKDFKSGDKTKVTSYLFSAYGAYQFNNNWFGQGVFSIGSSSSDNKENRRISNTTMQTAQGKYNSMIFSSELLGGYNHKVNEQIVVSPMFGFDYSRVNAAGYKETGAAGTPLLDVNMKASQKLNLVGGVKLTSAPFVVNEVAITPEAHAFVRHDIIGKEAKVNAKLPGLNTFKEKTKIQKTFYNIGAGVNAAYGAMDYGVAADANFANKYVGVQGTLKIRVNF